MSVSASSIAITPKQHPSSIGVPECSSDWWRNVEVATKANGFHQGNNAALCVPIRLNQIPDEWHQVAVRFKRANGIRDDASERSVWHLS
jgi:hypothetical protein